MEVQSTITSYSQTMLQEQAAMQVQEMSLEIAREQAVAVEELIASAHTILDPNLGQRVNIIA